MTPKCLKWTQNWSTIVFVFCPHTMQKKGPAKKLGGNNRENKPRCFSVQLENFSLPTFKTFL